MNIFINTKFDTYQTRKSGKHYVKISFTDVNGMFAVIGNVDDKKVSIQSFPQTTNEHIYGLTSINNYTEELFYANVLPELDNDVKATLVAAAGELDRSFRNHTQKNQIDVQVQSDVYKQIKEFRTRFQNAIDHAINENAGEKNDWKIIDDIVNEVPSNELNNVVSTLQNGNRAIFGNREYRIIDEEGRAVLQYRKLNGNTEQSANTANEIPHEYVVQKQRRKSKVAYMMDCNGLNEFVKGHFYEVVGNNGDYYTIVNEYGEQRNINRQRLRVIDVYAEPPFEEAVQA